MIMVLKINNNYYENNYVDYEAQNPERKLRFYREVILRHSPHSNALKVHDIGCAFGLFLGSLPNNWKRSGSDISVDAISEAAVRFPEVSFYHSEAELMPGKERFDVVTALDVFEHIEDLDNALREVWSRLVDGGMFFFVVPVYDGLSGPIIRRLDKDPTHIHKWKRNEWIELVSRKFEIVEWIGIIRYLLPGGYYLHIKSRALKNHTPAIAVICRKKP